MSEQNFPFGIEDISAWIIRRKDGTVVRYSMVDQAKLTTFKSESVTRTVTHYPKQSGFSEWCNHTPDPKNLPIFSNGKINLFIADASGARKNAHLFDVAIDGGGVLTVPGEYDLPLTYGDPKLVGALGRHVYSPGKAVHDPASTKVLKIRWNDRAAPPVYPSFWPALLKELEKLQSKMERPLDVLTICQGGHGRSGSALVALMMCMTDYTPLDALTHIRALHCARAIESKEQHVYLNLVAKELGREENALEAEKVTSFKERFLTLEGVSEDYKSRVRANQGAGDRQREAGYL